LGSIRLVDGSGASVALHGAGIRRPAKQAYRAWRRRPLPPPEHFSL